MKKLLIIPLILILSISLVSGLETVGFHPNQIRNNSLVAFIQLNNSTAGLTANAGSFIGSPQPGFAALSLTGTQQAYNTTNLDSVIGNNMTIFFRINVTDTSLTNSEAMNVIAGAGATDWGLIYRAGVWKTRVQTDGQYDDTFNANFNTGIEYDFALVWNTTHVVVYVNGTQTSATARSGTLNIASMSDIILNGYANSGCTTSQCFDHNIRDFAIWNTNLASNEIYNLSFGNTTGGGGGSPVLPTISFNTPPTPTNNSKFYLRNDSMIINASITSGSFDITLLIYNSTGSPVKGYCTGCSIVPPSIYTSLSGVATNSIQATINTTNISLTTGTYYYNISFSNTTYTNSTETRTFTLYDVNQNGINNPSLNQNITSNTLFISWNSSTTTPNVSNVFMYNVSIFNSTGTRTSLGNTTLLNMTINNFYNLNLTTGTYYINLTSIDYLGNQFYQTKQFLVGTNSLLNITAKTIAGATISNFSVNVYHQNSGYNQTGSTNGTYLELNVIKGLNNVFIDAQGYSNNVNSNTTLNITTGNYSHEFRLFETNTMNITFRNQATPATILAGPTIRLEIISELFSSNYTTTTGTLYIPLITPETYTMRYYAPGFATSFYQFTLVNRSYNEINLYMINASNAVNFSVYVVNEVLNPVEGAIVRNYKYNLANNTYILQEIQVTDIQGKVNFVVTFNDEYYKQSVEYNGVLKKTTDPDYIDTTSITIPITLSEINIIEDLINYDGISGVLVFNNATNNFRFDWVDTNLIASQYCLKVYQNVNGSQNLYNSSCESGASGGSMLLGVLNSSGLNYYGVVTYYEDDVQKYLTSLYYEFPYSESERPLGNKYGLFIQLILTLGMTSLAVLNIGFAMILAPFSLILGKILGWNVFSWAGLLALQAVGFILAIMASMRR